YFFKNANKTSERDLQRIIGSDSVIERAYEELNQFNWSEAELHTYEQEIKRIMDNQAVEDYKVKQMAQALEQAKAESLAEGLEKGLEKGKIQIARKLLAQNIDISTISLATELSIEEVQKLKNSLIGSVAKLLI
ncbi:MAG: hypothetical protein ACRYE9_04435, partial [Janthinobacterium lividum]